MKSRCTWLAALCLVMCASAARADDRAESRSLYQLGLEQKRNGKLDEAAASFEAALRADAKNSRAMFSLALLLYKRGDAASAESHVRRGLELEPSYGPGHALLGQLHLRGGKHQDARRAFEAALAASELTPEDRAQAHNGIGVAHRQEERWPEALAAFDRAIELTPSAWSFHNNRAIALLRSGRHVEAVAGFRRATELGPREADAWVGLGHALRAAKETTQAIAAYETAVGLDAAALQAWRALGKLYEDGGNAAKAADAYDVYLRTLAPASTDAKLLRERIERLRKQVAPPR